MLNGIAKYNPIPWEILRESKVGGKELASWLSNNLPQTSTTPSNIKMKVFEKHWPVLEQISPNKWGTTFALLSSFMTRDFSATFSLRSRFEICTRLVLEFSSIHSGLSNTSDVVLYNVWNTDSHLELLYRIRKSSKVALCVLCVVNLWFQKVYFYYFE